MKSQFEYDSEKWYVAEAIHHAWRMEIAESPQDRIEAAMRLAQTVERASWKFGHEAAALEGYASFDRREKGWRNAPRAHRRQTSRRRKCILDAARALYEEDPSLRTNNSQTAERIEAMRLEQLRKRDGTYLGSEAIRGHIIDAKKAGDL